MSLVGKIQSLFLDREKTQPIFPITKVKAVSDDNGKGLNVLLDDKASKDFVTAKIAEAQLGGGSGGVDLSGFATKDDLNVVNDKIPTTPEQIGAHPNTWMPTAAEIGAAPAGHVTDKSNPHGVTPAQIGAVNKNGDTMTGTLKVEGNGKLTGIGTGANDVWIYNSKSNKFLQLKDDGSITYSDSAVYHAGNKPTAADVGALPLSGGNLTGDLSIQKTNIDASLANNNLSSTQWPTSFHVKDKNGKTLARNEAVVNPNGDIGSYWYIRNYKTDGSQVAQKGIKINMTKSGGFKATVEGDLVISGALSAKNMTESADYPGCYYRTVDGVTEWLNPPMALGVEYRTTERWNGYAVYAQMKSLGGFTGKVTGTIGNGWNALVRIGGSISYGGYLLKLDDSKIKTKTQASGYTYFEVDIGSEVCTECYIYGYYYTGQ